MTDLAVRPQHTEVLIDTELLAEAQRHLSVQSAAAAINEALRRLVEQERAKRRAALNKLHQMHDEGVFNYDAVDE